MSKDKQSGAERIVVSSTEKAVLREMINAERATVQAFGLSDSSQQKSYERLLVNLDQKLSS